MKMISRKTLLSIGLVFLFVLAGCFFFYRPPVAEKITWGVDFSQKHSQNLGLNWKSVYLAFLEDLGAKNLKISTSWDLLEPQENQYQFQDLDWQIDQAQSHGAGVILVLGMKTPRWPECHIPAWAKGMSQESRQARVRQLLRLFVERYRDRTAIWAWQVENEPLLPFGECPPADKAFLKEEVALVKSLDPERPVIISDSGELSFWFEAAKIGDIVGTTLYRSAWVKELGLYADYPFWPNFYHRKAQLVKRLFGKKVINVELQAEPWGPKLLYDLPVEEQLRSFNLAKFRSNVEFARKTGLDTFYLWGGEWWYWMKIRQNDDSFWQEAKTVFFSAGSVTQSDI